MPDFLAIALLAVAAGDSLPAHVRPLLEVDGPSVAWTVAEYMDTTVRAWRYAGEVAEVIEVPGEGEVLVLIVPLAGEGQGTGVETLPPVITPEERPSREDGWCGRLITWERR